MLNSSGHFRKLFEDAKMLNIFGYILYFGKDLFSVDTNIPDNCRKFRIANAIDFENSHDVEKSANVFIQGFYDRINEERSRDNLKSVFLSESLQVFPDTTLFKETGRYGMYGWIEVAVKDF